MTQFAQLLIVLVAGASVAIADILIKRASLHATTISDALKHPLILIAIILYLCQIVLFSYVFIRKWDLGIVGIVQMVCYAAIVIVSGIVFFHEKMTLTHGIGIITALLGVILMNI